MTEIKATTSYLSFAACIVFFFMITGSLPVAITFMTLLAIHELGHYYACKRQEVQATKPIFTPFGAMIMIGEAPSAEVEAYIAYAGPLAGTLASIAALVLGVATGNAHILIGAYYGFFLNLFNLIPWSPLDGGRISQAISHRMWVLGAALLFLVAISLPMNPINMVVLGLIGWQGYKDIEYRTRLFDEYPGYYEMEPTTRAAYIGAYIGLAAFLFAMLAYFPAVVGWLSSIL